MPDKAASGVQPRTRATESIDALSVVVGLLFIAIAVLTLVDRFWAEIDSVLVVGGAVIAIGVAMMAGVIVRGRRDNKEGV